MVGKILSLTQNANFGSLTPANATQYISSTVIPYLKSKNVYIDANGVQANKEACKQYDNNYQVGQIFKIPRIQHAFNELGQLLSPHATRYREGTSYGFKHIVERYQGVYITNGDCILALLIFGIQLRAFKGNNPNCDIKAIDLKHSEKSPMVQNLNTNNASTSTSTSTVSGHKHSHTSTSSSSNKLQKTG